jgi:hypothetical protein
MELKSVEGIIENGFRVNDNKVIVLKIVESPSFQFCITQQFLDLKENERLVAEGLPQIQCSSVAMSMTYQECMAVTNFLFEYAKSFQKAYQLMVVPQK